MVCLAVLALVFLVRELDDTVPAVFGGDYLVKSRKLVDIGMGLWALGWHEKRSAYLNRSMTLKISVLYGKFRII